METNAVLFREISEKSSIGILCLKVVQTDHEAPTVMLMFVNEAFCECLGIEKDTLVQQSLDLLSSRIDVHRLKNLTLSVLQGQIVRDEIFMLQDQQGRETFLSVYMTQVTDMVLVNTYNITAYKEIEKQLSYSATHDILTGLPNRLLFQDKLYRAFLNAQQKKHQLAIAFIDLDGFKLINDALGHDVGDRLLSQVGKRLQNCLPKEHTLARLGGDEFTVLMQIKNSEFDISKVLENIIETLRKPYFIEDNKVIITASAGVSIGIPGPVTATALMKQADLALYKAKEEGRNTFKYFSDDLNIAVNRKMSLMNGLHTALKKDQFVPLYQPIVETKTNVITGFEVFLSWKNPQLGDVKATEFIPVLEEAGLMPAVGLWTVHMACQQHREWVQQGLLSLGSSIHINLSATQILKHSIIPSLHEILSDYQITPDQIVFEIAESVLAIQNCKLQRALFSLKDIGARIAIDDFGTGMASLSHLKRYPIDDIKIDGLFIKQLPYNQGDLAITSTLITLCHKLGKKVIAEAVETKDSLDYLKLQDCDYYQGYYFAKPSSASLFPMSIR